MVLLSILIGLLCKFYSRYVVTNRESVLEGGKEQGRKGVETEKKEREKKKERERR